MVSLSFLSSGSMKLIPRNFSGNIEFLTFHLTTFVSPSAGHFFPISSRVLATNDLAWMLAAFLSVSPQTTNIRLEVSLLKEQTE